MPSPVLLLFAGFAAMRLLVRPARRRPMTTVGELVQFYDLARARDQRKNPPRYAVAFTPAQFRVLAGVAGWRPDVIDRLLTEPVPTGIVPLGQLDVTILV